MDEDIDDLRRRLARAEAQVVTLEAALRTRSDETARTIQRSRAAHEFLRAVYRAMPGALFFTDDDGTVQDVNDAFLAMLGRRAEEVVGTAAASWFAAGAPTFSALAKGPFGRPSPQHEYELVTALTVLFCATPVQVPGDRRRSLVCVAIDISANKRLEADLRRAHKLESVGRLAAGIAHEINTPVQFVNDSVQFVRDALADIFEVLAAYQVLHGELRAGTPWAATSARIDELVRARDLGYAIENAPPALGRAIEGLERVAEIVRSMRVFAHPQRAKAPADLTSAIRSTLVVAASTYNLVADLDLDLCELPPVICHLGDINQALLNLVVNAGQAITDEVRVHGGRGKLEVRTRRERDDVLISIADTGPGIPEPIRERIFDPFFTTKGVGSGTGQGLAVAHAVVCELHAGALTFESELGRGTTFHVRLPIAG